MNNIKHNFFLLLFYFLTSISIVSCGGNDSSTPVAQPRDSGFISGFGGSPAIKNAQVAIYQFNNFNQSALLGSGVTDDRGLFSVEITTESQPISVKLTGGSYIETASGKEVFLKQGEAYYTSIYYESSKDQAVMITPLTHLAHASAVWTVSQGVAAKYAIDQANNTYSSIFNINIITTKPINITDLIWEGITPPTDSRAMYGFLLAGLSELSFSAKPANPHDYYSTVALLQVLYLDVVSDGLLDGFSVNNKLSSQISFGALLLNPNTLRNELALNILKSVKADYNLTGITIPNLSTFVHFIESNTHNIFGGTISRPVDSNTLASRYSGFTFVTGGEVIVYDYSTGEKGVEIIKTFTDIKGEFNLDEIYTHAKPILFELTGGRMIEIASRVNVPLTTVDTISVVVNHTPGTDQSVNINLLTSIARGLADYGIQSSMEVSQAVVLGNFDVSDMIGFDIIPTIPTNISIVSGVDVLNDSTRYGFILAAFSQLTYNLSVGFEANPHSTVNSLAILRLAVEDITADGLLDGLGRGASQLSLAGLNVDANTYRHLGAIGIVQFSENSLNKTSFVTADVLNFAANLNNSTNYIYGDLDTTAIDGGGATINNFTTGSQLYKTGTFTVTADISDLIGVSSVEFFVNGTIYGNATNLINPSFDMNTLDFNDCNCQFTIKVTNITGTITSKTLTVQIDNKRFIYVGGAGTTVYSYNPSIPGSSILVETNPADPIAALHPSGKFMYTTTQKRFNLHDFNGGLTTFDNVALQTGPNYYHHLMGVNGKYLYVSHTMYQLGPSQGEVKAYSINPDTTLTQVGPTLILPNSVGGVIAQNPVLPFLYLAQKARSLSTKYLNKVTVIEIKNDGSLSEMVDFNVTGDTPISLLVNKAGTALFVLYSLDNVVVKYKINSDGSLLFSDSVATGFRPIQMVFNKDESFVYVLAKYPTTVSVFSVSKSNGNLIEKSGSPYAIKAPNYGLDDIAFGSGGDVLFLNGSDGLQAYQNQNNGITFGTPDWETASQTGAIYTTRGGINQSAAR